MSLNRNTNENREKYKCSLLSEAGKQLMGAAKCGAQAEEEKDFIF